MNLSRNSSYTGDMSIVRNIAAVAKGMSITFGEMLQALAGGELPGRAGRVARSGV